MKAPPPPAAIQALLAKKKAIRLDIGCGANKQPGADVVGIDLRGLPGVDIVHDLVRDIPWPLPDGCARVVFMSHFWEHVIPWRTMDVMAEIHRICQPGGQLLIAGPYAAEFRFVQDPTHCNPSNQATFCYWDKQHPSALWEVYRPPVFHLDAFEFVPVGQHRDFNAYLTCCKPEEARCAKCGEGPPARARGGRHRTGRDVSRPRLQQSRRARASR